MAGIRLGWVASTSTSLIDQLADARHYTTISVSQIDDAIASVATSRPCVEKLLARNIELAKTNLAILDAFISEHAGICSYVKPKAGTTAFVKFERKGRAVDDIELCKKLHEAKGILVCPGSLCFGDGKDFRGYVRVGYVCETEILREGLKAMGEFFGDQEWRTVPWA